VLMAAVGLGNTGGDVFERGGPYLVRGTHDLIPTSQVLDKYSPELFCMIGNYSDADIKAAKILGGNGFSSQGWVWLAGPGNPYVYPDNLPRVNARGGPEGRPGCWQPDHARPVAGAVSGDGHRRLHCTLQPLRAGSAPSHRLRLRRPDRGEHHQPIARRGAFSVFPKRSTLNAQRSADWLAGSVRHQASPTATGMPTRKPRLQRCSRR
jgi:hypothetical protein